MKSDPFFGKRSEKGEQTTPFWMGTERGVPLSCQGAVSITDLSHNRQHENKFAIVSFIVRYVAHYFTFEARIYPWVRMKYKFSMTKTSREEIKTTPATKNSPCKWSRFMGTTAFSWTRAVTPSLPYSCRKCECCYISCIPFMCSNGV